VLAVIKVTEARTYQLGKIPIRRPKYTTNHFFEIRGPGIGKYDPSDHEVTDVDELEEGIPEGDVPGEVVNE